MTPNNANQSEIGSITFNGFTTPEAYANGNSCTVPAPGSGSIPGRYSDFSPLGSITVIERGQSISFSIAEFDCGNPVGFHNTIIYIDYNHDGFTWEDEVTRNPESWYNLPAAYNGSFTVPANALLGETRLRIVLVDEVYFGPCLNYSHGETEDWTVTIAPALPCRPNAPSPILTSSTMVFSGETFTMSLQDTGEYVSDTYQWQYDDGNGFTDIDGATSNSYSGTQNASTLYRCAITCAVSGSTGFSNPVLVELRHANPDGFISTGKFHSLFLSGCQGISPESTGYNSNGQLGDGTNTGSNTPVMVSGLGGNSFIAVSAGDAHSLFLRNDGTVWACGDNTYGQLGDGTNISRTIPVQVSGLTNIIAIAAGGSHSLFLGSDGFVYGCGNSNYGQLGIFANPNNSIPVFLLAEVSAIAAGTNHSLLLTFDGNLLGCGRNNYGQLGLYSGLGDYNNISFIIEGVSKIAAGGNHSLFVKTDNTVWVCGDNSYGQLGDGTYTNRTVPTQITAFSGSAITALSGGFLHSLFLKSDSTVWACGNNLNGELGDGTTFLRNIPVQVTGLSDITAIEAGGFQSLFLKRDGTVYACGANSSGQLGNGNNTNSTIAIPVSVQLESGAPDANALQIFNAASATLSQLTAAGTNIKWYTSAAGGSAIDGSAGLVEGVYYYASQTIGGCESTARTAVKPTIIHTCAAISGAGYHSLFIAKCSGSPVKSCGDNDYGQLGDGTTTPGNIATTVTGINDVISVSSSLYHSLFLKSDGTVWACGYNTFGQLGDGTTTDNYTPVQVSGLTNIIAIAAGYEHSIFLKDDGTVWVCGNNTRGQLGDGTDILRTTPVQVPGLYNIVAISAGAYHSLFLTKDGLVWSCGWNSFGQLGDGTTTDRFIPLTVYGFNIVAISAGADFSLFIVNDGTAWACGNNIYGQLGDGTTVSRSYLLPVSSITNVTAIEAGAYHSLFISNNAAYGCGYNGYGALGDGTATNRTIPQIVSGLTEGISEISAGGYHSLFLKNEGTVWASGLNYYGELGDGTNADTYIPVSVPAAGTIAPVSPSTQMINAGFGPAAGDLKVTGSNVKWYTTPVGGSALDSSFALADNTHYYATQTVSGCESPLRFDVVVDIINTDETISAGHFHSLFLSGCPGGYPKSCGINNNGQLGIGNNTGTNTPAFVIGLPDNSFKSVSAGESHSLFLKNDGVVWACGLNTFGALGIGNNFSANAPVFISGLTNVIAVAAGSFHSLFLKSDGTVWSCGRNNYGQLGTNSYTDSNTPVQVSGLSDIVAIAAGDNHSLFLKNDGSVWACGRNAYGQLGNGTFTNSPVPIQVLILADNYITAISGGGNHSLFLQDDGTVRVCGDNSYGQLGNGTYSNQDIPSKAQAFTNMPILDISAGFLFSLFLKNDGTVWACGNNYSGELGDGTNVLRNIPVQVSGLNGGTIAQVEAGGSHSLFMNGDGIVYACGFNSDGELGNGTNTNSNTAVAVSIPYSTAAPTGNSPQSFCSSASHTVADLIATGSNIQWYASSSGGTALDGSATLADGAQYYASQTESGCESVDRLEVTVSVAAVHTWYLDADHDGHHSSTQSACASPGADWSPSTAGPDCNDNDATATVLQTWFLDADADGYYTTTQVSCSSPGSGYVTSGLSGSNDCDDNDPLKWQSATLYTDSDGDGYDNGNGTICYGATIPAGFSFTTLGNDCNDNTTAINPGVTEVCSNGMDDNCNGQVDEDCAMHTYYADADQDTYGNPASSISSGSSTPPAGYVADNTDCNDDPDQSGGAVHPGAADICNSIDDNCNGVTDENALSAAITPGGNFSFCTGTTVVLAANTGSGLTYQWMKNGRDIPGATQSAYSTKKAANYRVKETNSFGCSSTSATTTLTQVSKPTATIVAQGSLDLCGTNSVVLEANSGSGLLYQWQKNAGYIAGATNQTYTAAIKGNYKCIVSNSAGCSATSTALKVTKSCKEEIAGFIQTSFTVYPNPTNGNFVIELALNENSSTEADVQIVNMFGQVIYINRTSIVDGELKQEVNLDQNIPSGNYFVRVILEDQVFKGQVVIQK